MSKKRIRVCIVIPSYNEEAVIADVIDGVTEVFKKSAYDFGIVCIDDGSRDRTASLAKEHGATVIRHILNTGAGGATATGLSYAEQNAYDVAITMDADGQHAPEDVLAGVKIMIHDNADLLIGSRLINTEGMSKVKIIGNKGLSFITYVLFGISSTDSQSGLRIFSRNALERLRWKTSGYEFCSEMLWRAKQIGLTISEYPIEAIYTEYSKAKGQNNWNAVNIVKSLLKRRIAELFG
ncbi:MAG TPA: glycosyltransferase family 2 protein [Candidatus Saccharimonadales bacterium]|nr:glycosyltransferase family 2 protein [Candidatus Saccharimonadales bacterium]